MTIHGFEILYLFFCMIYWSLDITPQDVYRQLITLSGKCQKWMMDSRVDHSEKVQICFVTIASHSSNVSMREIISVNLENVLIALIYHIT